MDIDTLRGLRESMTPGPLRVRTPVVKMEIKGNIHQVLNEDDYPVAFVPAWDNPGPGEVDGTDEAKANAHAVSLVHALIDQRIADAERIARLEAENARLGNALGQIAADAEVPQQLYNRNGPTWTTPGGSEYADMSEFLGTCNEIAALARYALEDKA